MMMAMGTRRSRRSSSSSSRTSAFESRKKPFSSHLSPISHSIMSGFLQPIGKLSLGGDHGDANCLSWSHDGSMLAAAFDDGSLEARKPSQSSS
jgi:hypothetical protein